MSWARTTTPARTRLRTRVISALAVTALGATLTGCAEIRDQRAASAPASAVAGSDAAAAVEPPAALGSIPEIVAKVDPSVVTVDVGQGVGSGVVYREGGIVVTNEHVVGNARQVDLELADGSTTRAEVVATDSVTDLAVLRAERKDLPPATFQREIPPVGATVVAIGSPLGFQNSATAGILSGVGREIPGAASQGGRALVDLLQTDAAISPGNSGGALVNAAGEVIGINEAYLPPSSGAVNIGFAIPATTVIDVVDQLLETGEAVHPYLGIAGQTLLPGTAEQFGLQTDSGIAVGSVAPDGPAAEAGVAPGDVIIAFGEAEIESFEDLLGELRGVDPGDEVQVTVAREGEELTLPVTVGEQPAEPQSVQRPTQPQQPQQPQQQVPQGPFPGFP